MRILLAEDDALLGAGLQSALGRAGFEVTWLRDGSAALQAALQGGPDALVLDIGLPGLTGLQVLQQLRAAGRSTPVLILTAQDSTARKVEGLEAGADDYLVKTAELEELVARLRALVRRAGRATYTVGELTVDTAARQVSLRGTPVPLSPREYELLHMLATAAGRVLTRAQLEQALWGDAHAVDSNALEVHVHNLRAKLGAGLLKTVRGVGYLLARPPA